MKRRLLQCDGFTMVEMILSIVLLGILATATVVLMGRGIDIYSLVGQRTEVLNEARYALVRMEKELEATSDIQSTTTTKIGFKDSTGSPTDFHLNGTDLLRGNDLLAHDITSLNFTCYRDTGAVTNSAQQTRRIQIDISGATTGSGGTFSLRTDVFPKNFMYINYR